MSYPAVLAGFIPITVHEDGSWEGRGNTPLASSIVDLSAVVLLRVLALASTPVSVRPM